MKSSPVLALAAVVAAAMPGLSAEVLPRNRRYDSTPGAFGKSTPRHGPHPAGTKLVRRFIRGSGRESAYWRDMYANLTGKQYGH